MNERIKEITGQVLDELVPETWTTLGYDKIKEIQRRTAELIVKECIDIAKDVNRNPYLDEHHHARQIIKNITKHFGVKE